MKILYTLLTLMLSLTALEAQPQWTSYTTQNSSLPADLVFTLLSGDDEFPVWAGMLDGGYTKTNGVQWANRDRSNSGLIQDSVRSSGRSGAQVWLGTFGGLSVLTQDSVYTNYTPGNSGLPEIRVTALLPLGDDTAWIGTYSGGVALKEGGDWTVYNSSNGLAGTLVGGLALDKEDTLWVATFGGISRIKDGQVYNYTSSNSPLPVNLCRHLTIDKEGHIWVGMLGGGVSRISGDTWTNWNSSNSDLPSNNVEFIYQDPIEEGIWIGTASGLVRLVNDSTMEIFNMGNSGLPHDRVTSILRAQDGALWVGTYGGLARLGYPVGTFERHSDPVRVWPNPMYGDFLTISGMEQRDYFIAVRELNGKMMMREWVRPTESKVNLRLNPLEPGIYVVELKGKKGPEFIRIIKAK